MYVVVRFAYFSYSSTTAVKQRGLSVKNRIQDSDGAAKKLAQLVPYLKGDGFEKRVSFLNRVLKRIAGLWLLVEPVTGSVVSGAVYASDLLDDLLNGLSSATEGDYNRVFQEVLSKHESRLNEIERKLGLLIPKAGIVFNHEKWQIADSHGISSVTEHSNRELTLNFLEVLSEPHIYIAHCNVVGTRLDVDRLGVSILLPENYNPTTGIVKVALQRVTGF